LLNISISYSSDGWFQTKLSAGLVTLFVRVTDNMGGVTIFDIPDVLNVTTDEETLADIVASMLSNNCRNEVVNSFQTGSMQQTAQLANAIADSLNKFVFVGVDTSNASISSNETGSNQVLMLDNRVEIRTMLVAYIGALPLSDISSLKLVASSLSTVTNKIGENSLASANKALDRIGQLVPLLQDLTQQKINVDDAAQIFSSITNMMANLFTVKHN
jgi:hypothetical protein